MSLFNAQVGFSVDQSSLEKMKKDLDSVVKRGDQAYIKATVDIIEAKRKLDELEKKYKEVLKTKDPGALKLVIQEIAVAQARLKDMNQVMLETDKRIGGMKQGFSQIGGYIKGAFGITAIAGFTKSVFTLASSLQDIGSGFKILLGDGEKATKLMSDIIHLAKISKFETEGLAKNAQLLLGFGFKGDQVMPILRTLGDSMQAVGRGQADMDRVSLAIGQILSKGRLMGQEMIQLTEAGIPAYTILQEKLKLSAKEMQNIGENGISARVALTAIFEELDARFAGSIESSSGNLSTKWNSFIDGIKINLSQFGLNISDTMGGVIDSLDAAFSGMLPVVLRILGDILGAVKGTFGGIVDIIYSLSGTTQEEVQKQGGFWNILSIFISALWIGLKVIVLSTLADIGKSIVVTGQNIGIVFSNIFEIAKVVFFNVGQVVRNGVDNIRVSAGMIGEAFSVTFNKAIDAVEGFINGASEGFNKFTGWIADKTGAEWIRTDVAGFSLQGYKLGVSGASGIGKGITDGLQDMPTLTPFKEYNFELGNLNANIKAMAQNDGLTKMLNGAGGAAKDTKKSFADLLKNLPGGDGSSGSSGTKKSKEETEALKKSVDRVKDSYTVLKNELDKVKTVSEKADKAQEKWAKTIKDAHKSVEEQLKKVRTEYEKTIDTINKDASESSNDAVGSQYRALLEERKQLEEEMSKAKQDDAEATRALFEKERDYKMNYGDLGIGFASEKDANNYADATYALQKEKNAADQKLDDLEKQRVKLESIKSQIEEIQKATNIDGTSLLSQNTRAKEDQRSTLDEKGQSRFDFQEKLGEIQLEKANKISAATDEFAAKRALALKNENIIKTFENQKNARGVKLENLKKQLDIQNQEKEQQDLIQKLFDERVALQKTEDEKKAVESRVFRHASELSTTYHTAELGMIKERKAEYDSLIEKIKSAIAAAEALRAAQASVGVSSGSSGKKGFSDGGYTGDGGVHEVAGEVHGKEYVIPHHVLESVKHIQPNFLPMLERLRTGQRAMATSQNINNSKSINLTAPIYVERPIDLQREFSKMMWRGF